MRLNRVVRLAREDGWLRLLPRMVRAFSRRSRDRRTAGRLKAPNFRAGAQPRILGLRHMRIGQNFSAGDGLWLEAVTHYAGEGFSPGLTVGENATLSNHVHIACLDSVIIGPNLLAGSHVLISDHTHGIYRGDDQSDPALPPADRSLYSPATVVIGRNVWLGDGVAVLPGAHIGDGAIIGANSVVNSRIPPATIAAGVPARPLRQWNPTLRKWLALPAVNEGAAAEPTPFEEADLSGALYGRR